MKRKKIVLIGASGFVGSAILNEALNRGHEVTAVVRNPEKIKTEHANLIVKKADISSEETVKLITTGADAVISAYNPGWTNPNIYKDTLKNYSSILNGTKAAGVKRLLCVGGAGTLFVEPGLRLMDTGVLPEAIMPGVKSLAEFYLNTLCSEKGIDWVFFSPAGNIAPGERTGKFRLGKDDLIVDAEGKSNISVEDYAVAMIDELERPSYHQERFTIGY
ncbi:NAD(P)-dependent oxidoreductase [uncultured Bacteroides sp.]|uniref:NAD(P)-dependent oxidoreductase n=1 Tax=uncultured Bacteroides sp. TaxID=162156 RepID=UPI002AAA75C3|nr:NAD(P)-dependent oxidoreductase [uncultured Bacteroides sp.]